MVLEGNGLRCCLLASGYKMDAWALREPRLAAVDLVRNVDSVKHSIFGWVRNLFSVVLAGADRLWEAP